MLIFGAFDGSRDTLNALSWVFIYIVHCSESARSISIRKSMFRSQMHCLHLKICVSVNKTCRLSVYSMHTCLIERDFLMNHVKWIWKFRLKLKIVHVWLLRSVVQLWLRGERASRRRSEGTAGWLTISAAAISIGTAPSRSCLSVFPRPILTFHLC